MTGTIWVLAEQRAGSPIPASLELVSAARQFSSVVTGFTYGQDAAGGAAALGAYGMGRLVDLGGLGESLPGPRVAAALAKAITAAPTPPDAVFIPTTYDGRDVAARLSASLDLPVITNVVGLSEDDGRLVSEHAIFGGSEIARAAFTGAGPAIFVIRPKSFVAEDLGGPPAALEAIAAPEMGATDSARIIARHVEERSGPSLDGATVVVAGGRGLGEQAHFALIEQLARLLKGAPGASRAIVDAGWVPYAYQIGQTGKTVKPEVYIACGISGATQHLVGMKGARHIIAINKDPSAPIFENADLGVIGDVNVILPRLIQALESTA